jgi:hypothetical protein
MSKAMGQQAGQRPEQDAAPTQWTFSVDITTSAAFDPNAYRVITGAATINLQQNPGGGYTGTMQFNAPTMEGDPNATQQQKQWSQQTYPLFNPSYANGILSFTVPAAVPAFLNNFDGNSGAPIPPAPAGPSTGVFQFAGYWDGTSNTITGGCCWVPPGWLEDAGGVLQNGSPAAPNCPPQPGGSAPAGGPGGEGGGDDPAMGTWTGGGG